MQELLDIGFGNYISTARLIALATPDSAPARRLIADARERSALIDATSGRKTRSILVMDSDHIILSALETEVLQQRFAEQSERCQ
ncbi:MAG: extracellular matrix/biofilm biosynthesis regulator RemA family protein [Saccharofermentanales bacterium]|jgi:regulator of extracellular matrix RemA (YlzA/DUF370 family)|nr:DUF370 domain-containing protein [Clostridiaceae bacterium]